MDSGCGSVGSRTVDSREQKFESSHQQIYLLGINFIETV